MFNPTRTFYAKYGKRWFDLAGIVFRRRLLCLAGILVLWVAAMPVISNPFIRMIEGQAVRMAAEDMPGADAIVVLSGGRVTAPGDPPVSEWNDPDRFFGGIALYQRRCRTLNKVSRKFWEGS
jgi:uncharacterized SAM-binding protein YcdF (DUF218 family)